MAVEAKRGCGYRKVGALYLCGSGITITCDRLPFLIEYCPVCGSGIKFTQGFTWIDWNGFAGQCEGKDGTFCSDKLIPCWICQPKEGEKYGLLWVGEAYYSPEHFIKEALEMGVSKRIPFVPKELRLGETIVLLAHKKGILKGLKEIVESKSNHVDIHHEQEYSPAIFYCFKPTKVEMLIYESELNDEKREELVKRNITPIPIPDGDIDHSDKETTTAFDPVTKRFSKVLLEE